MDSKEALEIAKRRNGFPLNETFYVITQKELDVIEKDLEELEELKKLIGTPIQDIMKRLKILDQLKEILSIDYLTRVYGFDVAIKLRKYLKSNDIIKEWLDNEI